MLPMFISNEELQIFNNFVKTLSTRERQVLQEIVERSIQHYPALNLVTESLPYHKWLLALLMEEHKEVQRLRRQVEELQRSRRL